MGTVLLFRDDGRQPRAEVAVGNGERIGIAIDRDGLTISQIGGAQKLLFQADQAMVGSLCAGLVDSAKSNVTPLQVIVAVVLQLSSAAEVERAFRDAADQVS